MRGFASIEVSVRARRRQATNKDKNLNNQQALGVLEI